MPKKYLVKLNDEQRTQLLEMIRRGRHSARQLIHARILLKADEGAGDPAIAEAVGICIRTVARVRLRFCREHLHAALVARAQPQRPEKRRLDGAGEARLVTLACSSAPEGHDHWTLQLLADRMVELKHASALSYETVRRILKKTNSSRG